MKYKLKNDQYISDGNVPMLLRAGTILNYAEKKIKPMSVGSFAICTTLIFCTVDDMPDSILLGFNESDLEKVNG